MKKFIAIIAAIAMIATMSVSVFAAAEIDAIGETLEGTVVANYEEADEGARVPVVVVDAAWSGLTFTYTVATEAWNSTDLVWEDSEGTWAGAASVEVTNRSSKAVNASVSYEAGVVAAEDIPVMRMLTLLLVPLEMARLLLLPSPRP